MRYLRLLTVLLVAGCSSVDDRVLAIQREQMGQKKIAEFCAMTEPQRRAFILRSLQKTNASGGYVGGRYYDTTVVLSSELGAERYEWRKITGC